ncbi:MAG: hypothetical protein JWP82_147 [Humibacillus sp.]|nr:hypothetical protein [Humibacillus sp.]
MTRRHTAAGLLLAALALTGVTACDASGSIQLGQQSAATDDSAARTSTLWANRTEFTGDNSKIIALVRAAGFGHAGTYTISLGTTARPYAVTVHLDDTASTAKPVDTTDFTAPATILLGTVRNLDEVHVVGGSGTTFTLTKEAATSAIGYDVKLLGSDEGKLRQFTDGVED